MRKLTVRWMIAALALFGELEVSSANPTIVEEIIVVGSRLVGNSPQDSVLIIELEKMLAEGYDSVEEALMGLPQVSGGSLNQQMGNSFTPAASSMSIRGVGLGRTLILVDGKRLPMYPIAAGGTTNFVDTSNIPLAAVERIEVLTHGASALYGSDAMGGLINIKLKESFSGLTAQLRYGDTRRKGRQSNSLVVSGGIGTTESQLSFIVDHDQKQSLLAPQRNHFGNLGSDTALNSPHGKLSRHGAGIMDTQLQSREQLNAGDCQALGMVPLASGDCGYDRSKDRYLLPETERTSAFVQASHEMTASLELYSRLAFSHSSSVREQEPNSVDPYAFYFLAGLNSQGESDPGFVTVYSANSGQSARFPIELGFNGDFQYLPSGIYLPVRRFSEVGRRKSEIKTDQVFALVGLKGAIGKWVYDIDFTKSKLNYDDIQYGYVLGDAFFEYLSSGTSLFQVMAEDKVKQFAYNPWKKGLSKQAGVSMNASGVAFYLPSGPVKQAIGSEFFTQQISVDLDPLVTEGKVMDLGGGEIDAERHFYAIYAETLWPLRKKIDLTTAFRYDHYRDFGGNVSPLFTLNYRPLANLTLRGVYTETFRAPDLQQAYGLNSTGFDVVFDPAGCAALGGTMHDPSFSYPVCHEAIGVTVNVRSNPELLAETGKNVNLEFAYRTDELDVTLGIWEIEIENMIRIPSSQIIMNNQNTYEQWIVRNDSGGLEEINASALNIAQRISRGYDLNFRYRWNQGLWGNFEMGFTGVRLSRLVEKEEKSAPERDLIATSSFPKWRGQFDIKWRKGKFRLGLNTNYIGSMKGVNALTQNTTDKVEAYSTMNVSGGYQGTGFDVTMGVNNVFDQGPKLDATDNRWPHYPTQFHSAIGTAFYISTTIEL